jgi:hypothetical protein
MQLETWIALLTIAVFSVGVFAGYLIGRGR